MLEISYAYKQKVAAMDCMCEVVLHCQPLWVNCSAQEHCLVYTVMKFYYLSIDFSVFPKLFK